MTIPDVAHLLEFLDAKEVAQLVHARKELSQDRGVVWHWISTRMQRFMPHVALPRHPPLRESLDPAVLVTLLRRLHVAMSYTFDVRFDGSRHGRDVRVADDERYVTNWGLHGGSIYGDRVCAAESVSYWECEGLSEGSYVGITEEIGATGGSGAAGFHYGVHFQRSERLLSMPTPACDNMPAIMYCESGFITNGMFRGPKPRLPAGVNILHAQPFKENDRVGVLVDLLEGNLVFLLNGRVQGTPIAIDRRKQYRPVFTARMCMNLKLIPHVRPPWHCIYDATELLPLQHCDDTNQQGNEGMTVKGELMEPQEHAYNDGNQAVVP
uniref:SPRY domain-containing protein n=1 Tax=Globisporangium ultimum (strain ATCC 200006 / CBS 805.95 / DAOM BR144) TaxID=431595 RepID=K3X8Z9_GLOUD